MIYLDNAATTLYKPPEVYLRSDSVFRKFSANAGRSGHIMALKSSEIIFSARNTISDFLGIKNPENVIFTFGCTDSLNILIRGLFRKGDHIITSAYEHNSVLRPLEYMKNQGIEYTVLYPDDGLYISKNALKNSLKLNTKAIIFNYVSNVIGLKQDMDSVIKFARNNGLLVIADCAQAAGVQEMKDFDYIACAGHKGLYGPQGIGILGIKDSAPLPKPLRFGGTGSRSFDLIQPDDMPEYLESGTLSVQNIASLESGVLFAKNNRTKILEKEITLAQVLIDNITKIKNTKVYSPKKAQSGVVAFNIENFDSGYVADILDQKYSICCRGGFHCAPLCHKFLGTDNQGAVRLSIGAFNTEKEIFSTIRAIEEIAKKG